MVEVSGRTIKRRMEEHGILTKDRYSSLQQEEIDCIIQSIQHDFPYRQVDGILRSRSVFLR